MTLNRTAIEWTNFSWNPVSGCRRNCEYCYAAALSKRFHRSFEPHLHPARLYDLKNLKPGDKVFVCSMGDLFGEWVPRDWIVQVLDVIRQYPHSVFQLLTKNPARYAEFAPLPDNCWAGATVTGYSPDPFLTRVARIQWLSYEPMLQPFAVQTGVESVDWIVCGAMTGPRARLHRPAAEWVQFMASQCAIEGTPLFMKDSIAPYWGGELIREYPE